MSIIKDNCGVCGGDNLPSTGTCDCAGVPNGSAIIDGCGVCDGNGNELDCNNNGILDGCESTYLDGYRAGKLKLPIDFKDQDSIIDIIKLVNKVLNKNL